MASSAVVPTARLYSAVDVVEVGSFPIYSELSSTNASDNPLTELAAVFAVHESVPEPSVFSTWFAEPSAVGSTQI